MNKLMYAVTRWVLLRLLVFISWLNNKSFLVFTSKLLVLAGRLNTVNTFFHTRYTAQMRKKINEINVKLENLRSQP